MCAHDRQRHVHHNGEQSMGLPRQSLLPCAVCAAHDWLFVQEAFWQPIHTLTLIVPPPHLPPGVIVYQRVTYKEGVYAGLTMWSEEKL